MATHFKYFFVLTGTFLAMLLSSCGSNNDNNDNHDNHDELTSSELSQVDVKGKEISAQNVFNSIPARAEIINLIGESKIEYNPDLLNNPEVASKYSLENSRALNLGAYGSDLSVSGAFDQTQESMIFLKCVNILAKNLGVSTAFDQRMMERMEAYKDNRDSTLEIIAQSFKKADEFLKENNRPATSSLILSGAWIEGMYISCQIAQTTKTENIIKTILGQEESLRHVVTMLEASGLGNDAIYILNDLKTLRDKFAEANKTKTYTFDSIKNINQQIAMLRKKVVETF